MISAWGSGESKTNASRDLGSDIGALASEVRALREQVHYLQSMIGEIANADRYRTLDILRSIQGISPYRRPSGLHLETARPIAVDSLDHRFPRGTIRDNTRSLRFVARVESVLAETIARHGYLRVLDLGCAGGGLVHDFLQRGHFAMGLEGSDTPKRAQAGEWPAIPHHLFTCDIAAEFQVRDEARKPLEFDVITAWDVLEHVPAVEIDALLANVVRHLAPGGLFIASVATFDDIDPATGVNWHVTVKVESWWRERLKAAGLVDASRGPSAPLFADSDFPRGPGNLGDLKFEGNAADGFYLVASLPSRLPRAPEI